MTKLGVNIDHIATIRQARQAPEPDPVALGRSGLVDDAASAKEGLAPTDLEQKEEVRYRIRLTNRGQ